MKGLSPGLAETAAYDPPSGTFSYAAHVCRVAVDSDTGVVEVERYAVVHDCGTIVNPRSSKGRSTVASPKGWGRRCSSP
jgi:aerobic carbon-monoxide dehydrogenase large subunit